MTNMNHFKNKLIVTTAFVLYNFVILTSDSAHLNSEDQTCFNNFSNESFLNKDIQQHNCSRLLDNAPFNTHTDNNILDRKSKPCFRFCCPEEMIIDEETKECGFYETTMQMIINITTSSDNIIPVDLVKTFPVRYNFTPECFKNHGGYMLDIQNSNDAFEIFENGTLHRIVDNVYMSQDGYCFSHLFLENDDAIIAPLNCFKPQKEARIVRYAMVASVPFMLLTVIVYIAVPDLRTVHGKSLCCYLTGLSVGYSILSSLNLIQPDNISTLCCSTLGYIAYFSLMSSFFWVSVISFEVFYKIRIVPGGGYNPKNRFIIYSIYSWGLALIALIITYLAEEISFVPENWKPQMKERCWLDVEQNWSAMLYFFGPLIIIISFNFTMFFLTAKKINSVQREMNRMLDRKDTQISFRSDKDRFVIFLRLFIVMGVTWSLEALSYAVGDNSKLKIFFFISDLANGVQGVIIFSLFVLRKRVRKSVTRRLISCLRWKRRNQNINQTISSTETN